MNPAVDLATDTERVVPTNKLRCGVPSHDAGGGGINVARVLTRLGGSAHALCPVGGPSGEWLKSRMLDEALASTFLPMAIETRMSFTVHEQSSGAEYRFVMPGPTLSEADWRSCLHALTDLNPFPVWVVASGSLPPGVPVDFYARLARLCRDRGARLVLDAAMPALAPAMTEGVYLVKPNLRELSELVGAPLASADAWCAAAQGLVDRGAAEVVALTLGHLGAVLATREGLWCAGPLPVPVVSAVGAGDSFVGGMVWALHDGQPLMDAFAWGVAAGSATLLTAGTGLCRAEDVQRLRAQVVLSAPATDGFP
ncbi:MAG: 6-phosphofructokinase 2 [Hydrogenophaga sp.]|jgi:6-phosphofructokinase 2